MLMARPSPETAYSTVWVAPGVEGPVGRVVEGVLGRVGVGVVKLGSVIDGSGATTVCWRELLMITSAITSPITIRTATPATIHSQRGDFGPSGDGGSGGSPGGYCEPYWPL